jgi:DNA-binding transcriptional MocR family regulator
MTDARATDYRILADRMAAEITADLSAGRRHPGDRLPPSRDYAHAVGIAPSTASRVYAELVRRGLVVGEVGRGTFLRATPAPATGPLWVREPEPSGLVDLEMNFSVLPEQPGMLAPALGRLQEASALMAAALQHAPLRGTPAARAATAALMGGGSGWAPAPETLLFAGSGRQAVAAALSALTSPGERVGFEPLTYPLVKGTAQRLGVVPVPLAMDAEGLRPDSIAAAHRTAPLRALYVQPCLHNPLGVSMPPSRRAEVAAVLEDLGIVAVEDAVYAFLAEPALPPLAAHAPGQVVLVDSLSKRVAPGLNLGFMSVPMALRDRVGAALRLGAWTAPGFALAAGIAWMEDGTIAALEVLKRADARRRHALARELLGDGGGLVVRGDSQAYHLWLELPEGWRAETFVAAAARRRIAVSPAAEFAVGHGHAPDAVRLALAAPLEAELRPALERLRSLALAGPEAAVVA